MFVPLFTITNELLSNIKRITSLVSDLNNKRFSKVVLFELERAAREVSSYASTSIEGNPLPLTEVKKILKNKPENIRDSEREVLNYNEILQDLTGEVEFSLDLILKIQKQVTLGLLPDFECGKIRESPVVVNNPKTGEVVYLPPDVKDVRYLMDDLIEFVIKNEGKIDPLILAGIFHKQMVIIHPFIDGNGRTARLATKVLMAEMGLNAFNLFSFENYYNKNVTRYFQMVGEVGDYYDLADRVDFTPWLVYFMEGIIDELLRVQKLLPKANVEPELKSYHKIIIKEIEEKGFIKDSVYASLVERAKATRTKDFKKLLNLGMIIRKARGKATYYVLKSG